MGKGMKGKIKCGVIKTSDRLQEHVVERQGENLFWQLDTCLAVYIRDSLIRFAQTTFVLPSYNTDDILKIEQELWDGKIDREQYEKRMKQKSKVLFKEWREKLLDTAECFDRYLKGCDERDDLSDLSEYDNQQKKIDDAVEEMFCRLKEVFQELNY